MRRRLESDRDAVQIVTVHASKGLQYPIVYCPYLWNVGTPTVAVPVIHDRQRSGARLVDVGEKGEPGLSENRTEATADQLGEALRLLYVAVTRARHQLVLWWVPATSSQKSALARVLFCRHADGALNLRCDKAPVPYDEMALERLAPVVDAGGGDLALEVVGPPRSVRWERPGAGAPEDLRHARLERDVDRAWRRTSYSALVAGGHATAPPAAEADVATTDDEAIVGDAPAVVAAEPGGGDDDHDLPLGRQPGGTAFGTLVHEALEGVDFAADDVERALADQLGPDDEEPDGGPTRVLAAGLAAALRTPLGPLAGQRRLVDVPRRDRLDELRFELPLAGGLAPRGHVTLARIAALLTAHLEPDDPLAGYPEVLRAGTSTPPVRGFLNGSIDLVLRLDERFLVVDYKTNRLASPGAEPRAQDYHPAALATAMQRGHYPLQALLYAVALHRYLRGGLPGYDPSHHLGGVLYLFLRGMSGPDVPHAGDHPYGVFSWSPPAGLVPELSDLLDHGGAL